MSFRVLSMCVGDAFAKSPNCHHLITIVVPHVIYNVLSQFLKESLAQSHIQLCKRRVCTIDIPRLYMPLLGKWGDEEAMDESPNENTGRETIVTKRSTFMNKNARDAKSIAAKLATEKSLRMSYTNTPGVLVYVLPSTQNRTRQIGGIIRYCKHHKSQATTIYWSSCQPASPLQSHRR